MGFDLPKLGGHWHLVLHLLCSGVLMDAMLPGANHKTWTYEIKSVESSTSDASLINVDLSVERVARGVYAVSGALTFNFDVNEGDAFDVEAGSFRSDNGVNDYKVLPFKMPRQHLFSTLNSFYKDMLMETLSECSNMPVFEDKFEPPFSKGVYTFEKCQFSQDGFPNHLADGFYKIIISGHGIVEWSLTAIAQVESAT
ncbi:uncharacterized protein [Musca autumnalis]|uniref:uncharacterized protein n=1 Tax=Musca autumnalis TaxID=221902 RepID=UPI003CF7F82A